MRPRHGSLPAFIAVLLLAGLSTGLARVMTSLHAVALRAAPAELGLLAASQSLGLVLMSLPSGALVRRHGSSRVFVGGSLVAALACAAVPFLPVPGFLVAASAVVGLCMPPRFVATNVVMMQLLDRDGDERAGWYRGSHLLSMFLLGPAIAVPAATTLGFTAAWGLVASSFLAAAAVAPLALGGAPARARGHAAPAPGTARRDPETRALAVTEFAAQGTFTYFSFFIVPIAIEGYGLGAPAATALLSAQAASYILTLFAVGGPAVRWTRARFVLAAYGAVVGGLLFLGLGRGSAALWAGSLVVGVGLGLVQLDNVIRAARVGARVGQGAAAGIQSLSGSSGGLATGLIGGAVAQRLGTQGLFLALAPLFGVLAWRQLVAAGVTRRPSEAPARRGSATSRCPASASARGACEG